VNKKCSVFFIFLFVFHICFVPVVRAQELKDELDALEAPQEEDLSGLDDSSTSTPSGDDGLPPDDELPPEESSPTPQTEAQEPANTEAELPPEEEVPETPPPAPAPESEVEEAIPDEAELLEEELEQPEVQKQDEPKVENENIGTTEALTGIPDENVAKLNSIQFRQLKDRVRLILRASRSLDFEKIVRKDRKQVIVELRNVVFAKSNLSRVLDTGEFDGPVALVQPFKSKAGALASIKVLFQLRRMAEPRINRSGSDLYIDFMLQGATTNRLFKDSAAEEAPVFPETFLAVDGKARYSGKKISLNVKDADLSDILALLSNVASKNFVLGEAVSKKITLSVKDTPWDQVLAIILVNNKLGYQKVGNVYRILSADQIRTELAEIAKTYEARSDALPLETRLIPINYAKASEIQSNVKDLQSKRGKISVDTRTNSIVVTDTAEDLEKILTYIQSIDKQTALIEIQARIVEASENFVRRLNLDWSAGPIGQGNLTGSTVNMRRVNGSGDGVFDFRIGNLSSLGSLNTLLAIAEQEDQAKIIASPRVTVLDNRTANISRGDQFNRLGSSVQGPATLITVNADLRLSVTPQVTSDGFVLLNVNFQRNTPNEGVGDGSSLTTRSASTEMLVESGKTGVIGGIYTIDKTSGTSGWPLFKNLPILGTLFTNNRQSTNRMSELLMFISPKILNSDKAFLSYKETNPESAELNSDSEGASLDDETL
jgi:type IV pilus assembly protein PilQ